tara:strand:+ start:608 stop:1837 length:1230 start_codon:yes stop_codon:yes gene_type:complete
MIYKEIREHILDLGAEDSGGDFEEMVKVACNLVYREILEEVNQDLERRTFTLTTIANRGSYGLPLYVRSVENIEDTVDNNQLEMITRAEFDRSYAGLTDTGPARQAYPMGEYGVERQPTESSVLKIVSTSTADVDGGNYSIVTRGFVNGLLTRESRDLDGTTTVSTTAAFDATDGIERLVLANNNSTSFSGTVTVKDADISSVVDTTSVTPTSTVFASDTSGLSSTGDIYNGKTITFTSGPNNTETQTITDYDGATKTFTVGTAFTAAPANDNTFTVDGWTLASIPPFFGDSPSYKWFELWPTPNSARELTVRAIMQKPPLINDEDWPEIPEEYHDLLIYGTAGALLGTVGKPGVGDRMQSKFTDRMDKFAGRTANRRGVSRTFGNVTQIVTSNNSGTGSGRFPRNFGV